jgi:hypothetical protein
MNFGLFGDQIMTVLDKNLILLESGYILTYIYLKNIKRLQNDETFPIEFVGFSPGAMRSDC